MKRIPFFAIALVIAVCCGFFAKGQSVKFFVSGDGDDSNPGTINRPFRTMEAARDAVRLKKQQQGHLLDSTFILFRQGVYQMDSATCLDGRDAGLPGAPVIYKSYNDEVVVFRGGREVPASAFRRVKEKHVIRRLVKDAAPHILKADLHALGFSDLGRIHSYGMNIPVKPKPMELIFNAQSMQLARWPNTGYVEYEKSTDVGSIPRFRNMTIAPGGVPVDPANPPAKYAPYINDTTNRPGAFLYVDDRPERWTKANDAWLFGYWSERWASQTLRIDRIDTKKKEIRLDQPHHYGIKDNGVFYAFNLLEEIDQPGEYYIDRKERMLYFWPPSDIAEGTAILSINEDAILRLNHTAHVILEGLTIEVTRGDGLVISGGNNNVVKNCVIRNIGVNGLVIRKGPADNSSVAVPLQNGVVNSEFYRVGKRAISIDGGDRKTLVAGGNYAVNNFLHDEASIVLHGCGNRVANNLIKNNPFGAIQYGGNDHLIEYNEIENCLMDADDWGTIYTGRDPSAQGTIIRFNYIHHNKGPVEKGTGSNGIYLDDGTVGQVVYGNVIYKTGHAARSKTGGIYIHGGKDNIISNNMFIDQQVAIGVNPWDQERWEKFLETETMRKRMFGSVDVAGSLYRDRYPLTRRLKEKSGSNVVINNLFVNCEEMLAHSRNKVVEHTVSNNWITTGDPGFEDAPSENFSLKPGAAVYHEIPGFQRIPFEKIGLMHSKERQ